MFAAPCQQHPGETPAAATQGPAPSRPAELRSWSLQPSLPSPGDTYLMGQAALQDAVPGDLTHVTGAELEDLGSDGVLLHQGLLQPKAVLEAGCFCLCSPAAQRWPIRPDPLQTPPAPLTSQGPALQPVFG